MTLGGEAHGSLETVARPMLYQILADLVVMIHAAFILFALFGGLLALRWHWIPWVHLPAAGWGTVVEFFGWICPLTPLENSLRRASGATGYSGGFIERHLLPVIYPAEFTREFQLFLGCVVVVFNMVIYFAVWRAFEARKSP
jgi:hypothetical protein